MTMTAIETTPRVWIGSLAAYNDGRLIGDWTDADDLDTLQEVAADVLKRGGGEEIALMDREGFGDLIGEYTPLERVAEIAQAIEEHGEAFRLYCENESGRAETDDVADLVSEFQEAYCGYWGGEYGGANAGADYAENLAESIGAINADAAWPLSHIDWEAAWRELTMDGYWETDGHVFRSY